MVQKSKVYGYARFATQAQLTDQKVVTKLDMPAPAPQKLLRVCAYARVSSPKETMLHSLSAQVSYYNSYIQKHSGWLFCGVYADEGISGTKENRDEFQRMMEDCRNGKIDIILCKSITRFARNTVVLLQCIRELNDLGVDVIFEKENIRTQSTDGELLLTILAGFAEEEALSASKNQLWRIKKNFEEGKSWTSAGYGYRQEDGVLIVEPEEAEVIRQIYEWYLDGLGHIAIAKRLREMGILNRFGKNWTKSGVEKALKNYTYTGNLLLQKTYSRDFITKQRMDNRGEKPMYHVEESHEAIISDEDFRRVQEEHKRRDEQYQRRQPVTHKPYTSKIECWCCHKNYRRKTYRGVASWVCVTFHTYGKSTCPNGHSIPETILDDLTADMDMSSVKKILTTADDDLTFILADGSTITKHWTPPSRKDSWTPEMKEQARQKSLKRWEAKKQWQR